MTERKMVCPKAKECTRTWKDNGHCFPHIENTLCKGDQDCPSCVPVEADKPTETIKCPFCNTGDFDLIGLKSHLEHGDCEEYNNTEVLNRVF